MHSRKTKLQRLLKTLGGQPKPVIKEVIKIVEREKNSSSSLPLIALLAKKLKLLSSTQKEKLGDVENKLLKLEGLREELAQPELKNELQQLAQALSQTKDQTDAKGKNLEESIKELKQEFLDALEEIRRELLARLVSAAGGHANRQILVNDVNVLNKYTDINFSGSITATDDNTNKRVDLDFSAVGGVDSVSNLDGTLTIAPTTGDVIASLNLNNANTWGALQTFGNNISFGGAQLNVGSLASGEILQYNGTNWVNVEPGDLGLVDSVSNSDGSLTISPTTGDVVASLNVNHANTWTQLQTFDAGAHFNDNDVASFGNTSGSPDLSIYSDGTDGVIEAESGIELEIRGTDTAGANAADINITAPSATSGAGDGGDVNITAGANSGLTTVGKVMLKGGPSGASGVYIGDNTPIWVSGDGNLAVEHNAYFASKAFFPDNSKAVFGSASVDGDVQLYSDGTDLQLSRSTGSPDFHINMPIRVNASINEYSSFGPAAEHLNPSDAVDMLVSVKNDSSGTNRAGLFIIDYVSTSNNSANQFALNAFAYKTATSSSGNLTNAGGGLIGSQMGARIFGGGTVTRAVGIKSLGLTIDASANNPTVTDAIGFHFSGHTIDDGTLSQGYGAYFADATVGAGGLLTNHTAIHIAAVDNASGNNYGLYIENASDYSIFVDAGLCRFDGNGTHVFEVPDFTPTSLGTQDEWIPVQVTGVGTRYIALYQSGGG